MDTGRNERLRQARERLGISRGDMAAILGVAFSTYSMIERGQRTLTPKHVKTISENTQICREWLESGKGEMLREEKNETLYNMIMSLEEEDREMLIGMIKRLSAKNQGK